MSSNLPVLLSDAAIEEFGRELDAIGDEIKAELGERDARYIRRLIKTQRSLALGGRLVIFASLAFTGVWPVFLTVIALGALALGTAKILENMEIAHNVMHGQWDWMHDPEIQSATWEWDNVCPSDQWKHSHNVLHHTWTNVLGMDRDIGYGMLRVSEQQRWSPFYLLQPLSSLLMAALFQWFIALHDLELNRLLAGKKDRATARRQWRAIRTKALRQVLKDYVVWPAMAGPFFFYVVAANLVANLLRNLWTYAIIFCGHFPAGVHVFTKAQVQDETRAGWYVRQLLGSCNITGGKLFHVLSGNLSHQIEHHLFPDMPSNRYPEIAPRVQALCARYGLPYNVGSFGRQFGTTMAKIVRLSMPSPQPAVRVARA